MSSVGLQGESQQILSAIDKVFKRRKTIVLVTVLGVLIPVLYYNETTPKVFEASTSLVFEEVGSGVPSEVAVTSSGGVHLFDRIEEIKSRAFADEIAQALPEDLRARFVLPRENPRKLSRIERIGEVIHQSMTAYPRPNSNIVQVRARMNDPVLSMTVANLSLDVLERRHNRLRREGTTDLRQFVDGGLDRFGAQLKESDSALSRYKQSTGITSPDGESSEALRKMSEAEILYNATRANQVAAQERLAAIERTLAGQRQRLLPSVTNISSPTVQKLKGQLVDVQARFDQLVVQGYAADHPQRIRLSQEIEETNRMLSDAVAKLAKDTYVGDPIAQIEQSYTEAAALQIEIEGLNARARALKETVDRYRGVLSGLPVKEVELARLLRERDVNAKIYTSLLERREEVRIAEMKQFPGRRVIDRAQLPVKPIRPRKALNLLLGAVFGLIAGTGLGQLRESWLGKQGTILKVEQDTGWSVLAIVPKLARGARWTNWPWSAEAARRASDGDRSSTLVSHRDPESAAGEAYFMLRTRLEMLGMKTRHRTLLITSSAPQEGKSSTVANLAAAFGAAGLSTLVVDAEVRRPVLHSIFEVQKAPGLSDLMMARNGGRLRGWPSGAAASHSANDLRAEVVVQPTAVRGVTLLASGRRVRQNDWEMAIAEIGGILDEAGKPYDVVLVDSASPLLVHDTMTLCGMVDAVLMVVDSHSYDSERVLETKRLLDRLQANVVGVVLNKVDTRGRDSYYYSRDDA